MAKICCWRSGEVFVARRVPRGAMLLLSGHGTRLKRVLAAHAEKGADGTMLMVPGVPAAANDLDAALAAKAFELVLFKALAQSPWHSRGGG